MPLTVPLSAPLGTPSTDQAAADAVGAQAGSTRGVIAAIRDASTRSGMNFEVMLASAKMESGLDPSAQAGSSSATGLFQFIDQTWLDAVRQYGPQHGLAADAALVVRRDGHLTVDNPDALKRILDLRKNPAIASAIAGDHLHAISDKLGLTLGRPPDATEIYLGHLLGGAGASQILQAARTTPNQAASDLLPAAARANPALFNAPNGTPYTVSQFIEHLRGRVSRTYAAVGAVMPSGPVNLSGSWQPASTKLAAANATAAPRQARQPIERQAIANLAEVFNRLDRAAKGTRSSAIRHHGKSQENLPAGLMTTLRGTQAGQAA